MKKNNHHLIETYKMLGNQPHVRMLCGLEIRAWRNVHHVTGGEMHDVTVLLLRTIKHKRLFSNLADKLACKNNF